MTNTEPLFDNLMYYLPFSGHWQKTVLRRPESAEELRAELDACATRNLEAAEVADEDALVPRTGKGSRKSKGRGALRRAVDSRRMAERYKAVDAVAWYEEIIRRFDAGAKRTEITF